METIDFKYLWGNEIIKINTLSPNKEFYYITQEPTDKYWGLFLTKIAFLNISGKLIYFNSKVFADPLTNEPIEYAKYLKKGNSVYYRERDSDNGQLCDVLIDLENERFKRSPYSEKDASTIHKSLTENLDLINEIFDKFDWSPTFADKLRQSKFPLRMEWFPEGQYWR